MSGRYTLYGRPGSGSAVCEAVLSLTGLPYDLVEFGSWEQAAPPPALLAVSQLAQVPVLVLPDGTTMTESGAITLHLADLAPHAGLSPAIGDPQRAKYLRWMLYLAAQSYPTVLRIYYPERYTADPSNADAVKQAAVARCAFEWSIFSDALGAGPFMLGDTMSTIDLYAAIFISWDMDPEALFARHPNIHHLYKEVAGIPALQQLWQRHGI